MPNASAGSAKEPGAPGLAEVMGQLRSAESPDARREGARLLLEAARQHCAGIPDVAALTQAADALLAALESEPARENRQALVAVAYEFIDLARRTSVRRVAYPAEAGQSGGQWLDRIIQLIERTDFTVGRMFQQRAAQFPRKTLFIVPQGPRATEYSWEQVAQTTQQIAGGVLALLEDNPRVAIFTPNRIEGALFDLACLTNGVFNTIVPANAVEAQLKHILFESGARMLVVSGSEQLQAAFAALESLPALEWVITLDALPAVPGARILTLSELMDRAKGVPARVLEERVARVRAGDVATTMYTSGTTGTPKGIKFTHLNLVCKRFARAAALPEIDEHEVFLCYLPLYHTFGRYLEMLGAAHLAATYVFAEDPSTETLIRHMRRFRPTAMIGVPKKWNDLRRRIAGTDEPLGDPEAVRRALRELTGGRLRWGLSAAGHLEPAVFRFFQYHGVDLLSGYGMTEATGGITMTPPERYVDDSIGKALPAIELRLDDDNELLLRGPYVSSGYTDPQEDATAFRDGWFCTGDLASRDAAGFYKLVDRRKDIYKNASGRTLAPQRIEALFADSPEVSRVFAVGDGREYVTLLIRPNLDNPEVNLGRLSDAALREYFRGLVVSCNRFLAPFERVVNFALTDREFSLEKGELTPKGSFRRSAVVENFRQVIEPMYASSAIERAVSGLRIKIPIAFLQHLGVTETDTRTDADALVFRAVPGKGGLPAADKRLRIRRDPEAPDRVWIGNCCYDGVERGIDLDDWLRLPRLWVGNAELTDLTGEGILLWSLSGDDRATPSRLVRVRAPEIPIEEWQKRLATPRDAAPSLLSVHAAAVALSGDAHDVALRAADYLAYVMTAGRVRYQELAESHLQHACQHGERAVRSRAFVALWEHQPAKSFGKTAALFCEAQMDFLAEEACVRIAGLGFKSEPWRALRQACAALRQRAAQAGSARTNQFAMLLLRSLADLAEREESFYLPVRQELMAWMLAPVWETIRAAAAELAERLSASFRQRLGTKQSQAVDPQTRRSYVWGETLQFEDGIDPEELGRMAAAFQHAELVREAVHLFYQGHKIDLADLGPNSIWISLTGTRFGRSIYHVGVRLRNGERCDFTLYMRSTAPAEAFLTDLHLLCVAAGGPGTAPLTPQLGGYWPEYGLATLEHVPGESVEALVGHMRDHPDRDIRQRLRNVWQHLAWSALTAAFEFQRRTEGQWMLTGTVARDISVPLNDFDENTRILSAAGWRPFRGTLDMLLRLKHAFLDRVRFHFPALAPETDDEILFAAALEAYGLREGLAFLKDALAEVERQSAPAEETVALCGQMQACVTRVTAAGYMPKALHFAIARYQAWAQQVPEASVQVRAAQLQQLQNNYHIDLVARRFPEARLWLYAETVLQDSPEEGRSIIAQAIQSLREGGEIAEVLGRLYADLREKLPTHDQQYFLTRAAYPHLELDEKAELVTTSEVGPGRAELVTVHADRTGREFRIRPPANPAEVDTLYRAFYTGGIGGGLTAHEKFLVAVDQASYVAGGVGYIPRTPYHVLLDKVAVLPRCRGRGIGRLLMHEFLRRQAAEGAAIVSAEFIRDSWLAQFGFRPHPRYAGVVLALSRSESPAPAQPRSPSGSAPLRT
jgi:long-subunit acyl-CoA synthetase (AMP-forming)/GNAT superfamily N-acetyltransferase